MDHYTHSQGPFGHLDCQENPYDLGPAVRRIMAAETSTLSHMPKDAPLVIIMGEYHEAQGHALLQKAVLMAHAQLREKSDGWNFAFGYESPHDYISKYTGEAEHDPDGHKAINLRHRFHAGAGRTAHLDLLDYCVRENISVSFNDSARDQEHIDCREPFTRTVIEKYFPSLVGKTPPLRAGDNRGIAISNLCMVEKAIEHIQRTQARIYIQHCGQGHVFGATDEGYAFEESLSSRFRERGIEILPVICNYEHAREYIPAEAESLFGQSVILSYNERAPDEIPFEDARRSIGFQSGLAL